MHSILLGSYNISSSLKPRRDEERGVDLWWSSYISCFIYLIKLKFSGRIMKLGVLP